MTALLSILVLAMGPFAAPVDAGPALCADQPGQVEMAFDPGVGEQSACNADANCTEGPDVHCSGNSTCTAIDQSCPFTQGWVRCDGVYTYCAACPPCSLQECRQPCKQAGCFAACVNRQTCECETICY